MDTSTVVLSKVIPDGGMLTISKFDPNYIVNEEEHNPDDFALFQNYPNPFNPTTTIRFTIPKSERQETQDVSITVFDLLGSEVKTLVNEEKHSGEYSIVFDASSLPSGIYIYILQAGSKRISKKMLLLK